MKTVSRIFWSKAKILLLKSNNFFYQIFIFEVMTREHFRIRPRFKVYKDIKSSALEKLLQNELDSNNDCEGHILPGHVTIHLPAYEQHFWSPQLNISFEDTEEGTIIRGLYGPRPQVWTLFVLFYSIIGFGILFIGFYGLTLLSLDKPAGILWLVPVLVLVFLSLYLVAYSGQKASREQMHKLYSYFKNCTGVDTNAEMAVEA